MSNENSLKKLLFFIFIFLCCVFISVVIYIRRNFALIGSNPISQILFHCIVQIDGADPTFIKGIAIRCFILPLLVSVFATIILFGNYQFFKRIQNIKLVSLIKRYSLPIALACVIASFIFIANELIIYKNNI